MRAGIFLTLSCPLVDIITCVDDNFLKKFNLKPNNAIVAQQHHAALFKELQSLNPRCQPGGCALNTARVFQWILKVPHASVVIGTVGKDAYGAMLKQQLAEENVKFILEEIKEPTGKCGVLLTGCSRSLCTDLGASKFFPDTKEEFCSAVRNAACFYAPGFFLRVSFKFLLEVAKHSHETRKTFCFNLSASFLPEAYKEELDELLPFVNVLFGNEAEARAYAMIHRFASQDLKEIILYINKVQSSLRENITVITRGPESVLLANGGVVTEYPVEKIPPENIKDTNAAGDAFVGGFLAEFVSKKSLGDCVKRGISAAGRIIETVGCSFPKQN